MLKNILKSDADLFIGRTTRDRVEFTTADFDDRDQWNPREGFDFYLDKIEISSKIIQKMLIRGLRLKKGSVKRITGIYVEPCLPNEAKLVIGCDDEYYIATKNSGFEHSNIGCEPEVDTILILELEEVQTLFIKNIKLTAEAIDF